MQCFLTFNISWLKIWKHYQREQICKTSRGGQNSITFSVNNSSLVPVSLKGPFLLTIKLFLDNSFLFLLLVGALAPIFLSWASLTSSLSPTLVSKPLTTPWTFCPVCTLLLPTCTKANKHSNKKKFPAETVLHKQLEPFCLSCPYKGWPMWEEWIHSLLMNLCMQNISGSGLTAIFTWFTELVSIS